jgi:hypothetical protein
MRERVREESSYTMELIAMSGVVVAAVLLTALVTEVLARRWIRADGRYFVWRPHYKRVTELNPAYSPFLKNPVRFLINREGERGGDVPETSGKLYRVLVAGGSTAECVTLDQDAAWPQVLERILEANKNLIGAAAIHVGNIAKTNVEGSGIRVILEKVLPRYPHLDLIIVVPGIATVGRWLGEGCPSGRPPRPLPMQTLFVQYPEMGFGWGLRKLALAELAQRWLFRFTSYTWRQSGAGRLKIAITSQRSRVQEFYPLVEDPSGMLDAFEQELRRALALAQARAARVILVRPFWFQKDHLTADEEAAMWLGFVGKLKPGKQWQFVSHPDLFKLFAMVDQRAAKVAQELEVEAIDLKGLLEPRLGIYYDNCHLTAEGAAMAAQRLASVMLSRLPNPMTANDLSPGEVATKIHGCQRCG